MMRLMEWWRQKTQKKAEVVLLPCDSVLFPGGRLSLTLTDLRWQEILGSGRKQIGVCLQSRDGLRPVGTLGDLVERHADGNQLRLTLLGRERFRLRATPNIGQAADFDPLPAQSLALPERFAILLPLVRKIVQDHGLSEEESAFDNAEWVGFRLCEVLPIQALAKYRLLELENPVDRLEILVRYLEERNLLS